VVDLQAIIKVQSNKCDILGVTGTKEIIGGKQVKGMGVGGIVGVG